MRKSSFFANDDLRNCKSEDGSGLVSEKKNRYAPLKDGTRAIAKIAFFWIDFVLEKVILSFQTLKL